MSFVIDGALTTSTQTLTLRNSGAMYLQQIATLPFYIILKRDSDSAVEIVRAVAAVSSTELTILRGQLGSTAITFSIGDDADYLSVNTNLSVQYFLLGSPALGSTTAVHAAVTLSGSPQTITTAITNPAVARQLSQTGNAVGITGNVTYVGTDLAGNAQSEDVALNGTTTVYTTKAYATLTSYTLPVETHVGTDTVVIGTGPALGIPFAMPRNTVLITYLAGVRESTAPTVVVGSTAGASTITLSSALNGTAVSFYAITQ